MTYTNLEEAKKRFNQKLPIEVVSAAVVMMEEIQELRTENAELKVELAKFYPCEPVQHGLGQPGVVCIDYAHMGINHVGEVWHKEEE